MKAFSVIICLSLCSGIAVAQLTLSGMVKDSASGNPLPNASVVVENTFIGIAADKNGSYKISNLKKGTYVIKCSYIGYKTESAELNVDADKAIDFMLAKLPVQSDEIIITATRANEKSAMAFTSINKEELEKNNLGQDVPCLLSMTPSAVTTSDAGAGIGYTGIRIRGSDPSRINVTINGIPLNDSESQNVYWVDLPDFASSIENIQIQRGAGTSTNGAGAFGGSINVLTSKLQSLPFAQSSAAAGSFNTLKTNMVFGSGLISDHFSFEGRASKISSDGFIDRASSDLKSFSLAGAYYGKSTSLRLNIFSGKEITYQAWNGVPEAKLKGHNEALLKHYYNNLGILYFTEKDSVNLFDADPRTYNYYRYDNQVDDYRQDHYQLLLSQALTNKTDFNIAFHYTKGAGFFEQFEYMQSFSDYNLDNVIAGNDTIASTDLIRRRWLDNDFYGTVFSVNHKLRNTEVVLGGAWNQYSGNHFGEIIWAQYAGNGSIRHRYYDNGALKTDFNLFAKIYYDILLQLSVFGDLQWRKVGYNFSAFDDQLNFVPQTVEHDFINPKAGVTFKPTRQQSVYASVSVAHREPSRDDYTETSVSSRPLPEEMIDLEAGYKIRKAKFSAAINYYHMLYKNQLVLTGKVNDVGNYTRTNIAGSYRQGIEVEAGYSFNKYISLKGNCTLSRNKIKAFVEFMDDYDIGEQVFVHLENTDIAFSPSVIGAGDLEIKPLKNISVHFLGKYVSRQYLDNTSNNTRSLDAYLISDVRVDIRVIKKPFREISLGMLASNILDEEYESNGYTYSYRYGGELITENFYYPQAGRNFLAQITVKF